MARLCEIDGCERAHHARGLCRRHYAQLDRRGLLPSRLTAEQRFWAMVTKTETCWLFNGSSRSRYGRFRNDTGRQVGAHQFAYELLVGPIPKGWQVDHQCRNKHCVNPSHLRLATTKENQENLDEAPRNSRSGVRGVRWHARSGKWEAVVCHHGRTYYAGRFPRKDLATQAAIRKRVELFTHNDTDRVWPYVR
jgi:hypothetical protein